MSFITGGVENLEKRFVDASETLDPVFMQRLPVRKDYWNKVIPRGEFKLGEGLTKRIFKYWPGIGDMNGLAKLTQVRLSAEPSGEDPGHYSANYTPYMIKDGTTYTDYILYETVRQTSPVNLRDIRFMWQFKQQLAFKVKSLVDIAFDIDENIAREFYIKMATDAGRNYIMTPGGIQNDTTFTYDPFLLNENDRPYIKVPIAKVDQISTIDWTYMNYIYDQLSLECPMGATGNKNSMPIFSFITHLRDFHNYITLNTKVAEDFRFARSEVQLENYGTVGAYGGWGIVQELKSPRLKLYKHDATYAYFEFVPPFKETAITSSGVGTKADYDPEYNEAEIGMIIIGIKDVYQALTPPNGPSNPAPQMFFEPLPSYNGEFKFKNEYHETKNPNREVGFFWNRKEISPKPLDNYDKAMVMIYKRTNGEILGRVSDLGLNDNAVAVGTKVYIATTTSYSHVAGSSVLAEITLTNTIDAEVGDEVTVTDDNAATWLARIAAVNGRTYTLSFLSGERPAEADMNSTTTAAVTA